HRHWWRPRGPPPPPRCTQARTPLKWLKRWKITDRRCWTWRIPHHYSVPQTAKILCRYGFLVYRRKHAITHPWKDTRLQLLFVAARSTPIEPPEKNVYIISSGDVVRDGSRDRYRLQGNHRFHLVRPPARIQHQYADADGERPKPGTRN